MNLICQGCKVDLSFALKLPLQIRNGKLMIECPVCGYYTNITITKEGMIKIVDKN